MTAPSRKGSRTTVHTTERDGRTLDTEERPSPKELGLPVGDVLKLLTCLDSFDRARDSGQLSSSTE
jgi:hypothetical protein